MSSNCPHCGCSKIEVEPARGDAICTSCGTVLSEHNIVSEVQFSDKSKGTGSAAVGQFVANDGISKRSNFSRPFSYVISRDSKEITLSNARRKIKGLSQMLRLNDHCVETAFNFFKLALSKGMTKGRKSELIVGACVYLTCRTESTAHMLLDVSDALQVDVYELGRCYLRLSTALCIAIPTIDPCLYIWRFAYKLSFGDKTREVSETALRLVKRMKKDWMHMGRRPSGLCGAALVLAARFHDFNRTLVDVIRIVRVHESTLRKRLSEFGRTPSSALTLDEFMHTELTEEQDPPAFTAAKKRKEEELAKLLDKNKDLDSEFTELQCEIERQLGETKGKLKQKWAKLDVETNTTKENQCTQKFITEVTLETINDCIKGDTEKNEAQIIDGIPPSAASLGLKDSIEQCMEARPPDKTVDESDDLDLTGIDDDEIDSYILSEREIRFKTKFWMELNREYLEEMKLKEEKEREEEELRKKEGRVEKKKKKYQKKSKNGPATTAGEAIEKMLQEKKLSSKINYDVLKNLNGDEDIETDDESTKSESAASSRTTIHEPIETPVEINNILSSLTGKHKLLQSPYETGNNKRLREDTPERSDEENNREVPEDIEEEEEDGQEEENEEDSVIQLLRKRRGLLEDIPEEFEDYD